MVNFAAWSGIVAASLLIGEIEPVALAEPPHIVSAGILSRRFLPILHLSQADADLFRKFGLGHSTILSDHAYPTS
jgi:hypothetical protein